MSVASFIRKYGAEALATASALGTMLEGLALSPAQNAKVQATIDKLETAATNIADANFTDPTPVKIAEADIDKAVADYMNSAAGKSAVAAAVAAAAKTNA